MASCRFSLQWKLSAGFLAWLDSSATCQRQLKTMNEEIQLMNGKALESERVDICRDSVIRSSVRIAIPEAAGTTPCESMNANRREERLTMDVTGKKYMHPWAQ
ncbi:hypothetical protein BO85DRAFT_435792 [Aspergillus piperis CBS 112811]|uniref:Uncharacterized protein n=1 Tax=Aspergillus piperis CBS 112811 TaxID=1448313 RepID=A0A8G1R5X2_9EURO|nr:hypothetical protein BO85DRAFT_435792 [Aspergillus piperis CBS 112811]RAH60099.1 hypothetical protein BO85DRAFT_435792 [Aspergillus piperis CBS 112811]